MHPLGPKPYEVWADDNRVEGTLVDRARGQLGEMESTKQLVELLRPIYQPGMTVLDAGCNVGHYLVGLRRLDPALSYTGVDAYQRYVDQARQIFADDANARFEVKSIMEPLFPDDPFDIVFSCNVLIHLPEFRTPLKHLLNSTKRVCFVRTLLGDNTTIVLRAREPNTGFDAEGKPLSFVYQNQYAKVAFSNHVQELGWKVEYIDDAFDPRRNRRRVHRHQERERDPNHRWPSGRRQHHLQLVVGEDHQALSVATAKSYSAVAARSVSTSTRSPHPSMASPLGETNSPTV